MANNEDWIFKQGIIGNTIIFAGKRGRFRMDLVDYRKKDLITEIKITPFRLVIKVY